MMKVNPGCPHVDGTILPWYDKWTIPLAKHYAEVFNLTTDKTFPISEISAFSPKFLIWSFNSLVTSDGLMAILIF